MAPIDHIKVWLDDTRAAPEGWTRAYWPQDVFDLLMQGRVTHVSLDHDLGDDSRGTGYDVIRWIEEAVVIRKFKPPLITVHSANPVGRERMMRGIASIQKAHAENA